MNDKAFSSALGSTCYIRFSHDSKEEKLDTKLHKKKDDTITHERMEMRERIGNFCTKGAPTSYHQTVYLMVSLKKIY